MVSCDGSCSPDTRKNKPQPSNHLIILKSNLQKRLHIGIYALGDFMTGHYCMDYFFWLHRNFGGENFDLSRKFIFGLFLYPSSWIILYHLSGAYKGLYYKSRLMEFLSTFFTTFIGSIILFFIFILYKKHQYLSSFYGEFFILFALAILINLFVKIFIFTKAHQQLQREEVWFNTLIIGSNQKVDGTI